MKATFSTKSEARAGVSFLTVIKLLEKGFIDERLNPRRTKDRLVVSLTLAPNILLNVTLR